MPSPKTALPTHSTVSRRFVVVLASALVGCSDSRSSSSDATSDALAPPVDVPTIDLPESDASPTFIDGCEIGTVGGDGGWRIRGIARYLKRLLADGDGKGVVLTAVRRAEIVARRGDVTLATTTSDDDGCFQVEGATLLPTTLVATAKATGPHLAVLVTNTAGTPWTIEAPASSPMLLAEELYVAGAFNVVDAAVRIADVIPSSIPDAPVAGVVVRWSKDSLPACGSCYYATDFVLELTGATGDIDAHDDAVVMHELGHWVEAAFGVYSNPGGNHDMEKRAPTLAWSEGFATWLEAVVRGVPDYVDRQPSKVYRLNVESPPTEALGVAVTGNPSSDLSEALVYGALWDLVDAPAVDDDPAHESLTDALAVALTPFGTTGKSDAGPTGADFTDFLRHMSCRMTALAPLQAVLDAFQFPWTAACPATPS